VVCGNPFFCLFPLFIVLFSSLFRPSTSPPCLPTPYPSSLLAFQRGLGGMKVHAPMILAHFALEGIDNAVAAHQNVFFDFEPSRLQKMAEVPQVGLVA